MPENDLFYLAANPGTSYNNSRLNMTTTQELTPPFVMMSSLWPSFNHKETAAQATRNVSHADRTNNPAKRQRF